MKLKHAKKTSGFTLVELLVVIAIIAALAAISSPIILRQVKRSRATAATNNAKDIYQGLRDFSTSYGASVGSDTGDKVESGWAGTDANDYLTLLFDSGIVQDEKPFYVNIGTKYAEGDGDISSGNILEDGANSFAVFVLAGNDGVPIIDIANAPLMSCPFDTVNGTATTYQSNIYDKAAFGGKAVVLRADGSAVSFGLKADGTLVTDALKSTTGSSVQTDYTLIAQTPSS